MIYPKPEEKVTTKMEEITPIRAQAFLSKSIGNRNLKSDSMRRLGAAITGGKWDAHAGCMVFDEDDAFVDGHHRCQVVIETGITIWCDVKRGVSRSARNVIDTGDVRRIHDLFRMFRPNVSNVTIRVAALTAASILLARPPRIKDFNGYDAWEKPFQPALDILIQAMTSTSKRFTIGPILGAFVFAHKAHPEDVLDFARRCVDGVGLRKGEPAHTTREYIQNNNNRKEFADRVRLAKRILGAIHADINGQSLHMVKVNEGAYQYFRDAYLDKSTGKLIEAWTHGNSEEAA